MGLTVHNWWMAWHESNGRNWCPFVDLHYMSAINSPCWILTMTSRKCRLSLECAWANLKLGWKLLKSFKNLLIFFSLAAQMKNISSIYLNQIQSGLFSFEKFPFNVIHKDTCLRWSKFSSNSRSRNLMFKSWTKFNIIALGKKLSHFHPVLNWNRLIIERAKLLS